MLKITLFFACKSLWLKFNYSNAVRRYTSLSVGSEGNHSFFSVRLTRLWKILDLSFLFLPKPPNCAIFLLGQRFLEICVRVISYRNFYRAYARRFEITNLLVLYTESLFQSLCAFSKRVP